MQANRPIVNRKVILYGRHTQVIAVK